MTLMKSERMSPNHSPEHQGAGRGAGRVMPKTPPKNARRRSRELAMQGVYQWLMAREDLGAIEAHLLDTSPHAAKLDRDHFVALLHGAVRERSAMYELLTPHLDRPVDALSPVEHATLLIGAFELSRHLEIPYRVVINEAVELAKGFGGTDGYKYINGVLDKVAGRARGVER